MIFKYESSLCLIVDLPEKYFVDYHEIVYALKL